LGQFSNITSGIYPKYHVQNMLLFVYTTIWKIFWHARANTIQQTA